MTGLRFTSNNGVAAVYISPGVLYRWAINALALLAVSVLVGGVNVSGPLALLVAAGVLGLINAFVRPVLFLLTLPINIVTLGLFTFVLNGLMLWFTSGLVPGFHVSGFWAAVWASILLSVVSALISMVVKSR